MQFDNNNDDSERCVLFMYYIKGKDRREAVKSCMDNGMLLLPRTLQCTECEDGKMLRWLADVPLENVKCKCGKTYLIYWHEIDMSEEELLSYYNTGFNTEGSGGYKC